MKALLDRLRSQNPRFADLLLNPLLSYLLIAREVAGGDLDHSIILLTIAIRSVEHPEMGGLSDRQRSEDTLVFPSLGVNASSISQSSGIPRETVRRKVALLVQKGWIAREGQNLHFTAKAWRDLEAIREAREQLAIRYYELVRDEVLRTPSGGLE